MKCKKLACSLCLLIHCEHFKEIEIYTEKEILQEAGFLIEISNYAIDSISHEKEVLS